MKIEKLKIQNIIFDLGGVILDIDIKTVVDKFTRLGIGPGSDGFHSIQNNQIFKDYEIGITSSEEFRNELRKISRNNFTDDQFDQIWNSIIIGFPDENIDVLKRIKHKYRTFLMSNTNELHYLYYTEILRNNFNCENLDEFFEKSYYSHTSHMRKPEAHFFELILKENSLIPDQTLFIDDFAENIEAAEKLGIKTLHLKAGSKLDDYF
jgi:putative hydrolase of the HAD superfamily